MTKEEYYEAGMDLFGEDQLDEAIAEFQKALQEDPDFGDVLHAIAMCHYHKKEYDKAIEYGERLRRVEPDNTLAYTSLSMFYNAKGWIQKAEDMGARAQAVGFNSSLQQQKRETDS